MRSHDSDLFLQGQGNGSRSKLNYKILFIDLFSSPVTRTNDQIMD